MDLSNFINNFRANVQDADRLTADFTNRTAQGFGNAMGIIGNALGQTGNTIGQAFTGQLVPTQTVQPVQPVQQVTQQPVQAQLASTSTPVVVQPQVSASPVQYINNPAYNGFINTLRYIMNPIRGITGWTPTDIVSDILSAGNTKAQTQNQSENTENKTETKTPDTPDVPQQSESSTDTITYTYRPGDSFGQVIMDLGLNTNNGLWGANGDVDYYTRQLIEQGLLNPYGNIPIGTTIKLRRRK